MARRHRKTLHGSPQNVNRDKSDIEQGGDNTPYGWERVASNERINYDREYLRYIREFSDNDEDGLSW